MKVKDETTGRLYEAVFRSDIDPRGAIVLKVSDGQIYRRSQVLHFTIVEESDEERIVRKKSRFRFQGE